MAFLFLQSISAPGSGIWSDGKDKNDGSQTHTWNVEVLIDIVKEVVSELSVHLKTRNFPGKTEMENLTKIKKSFLMTEFSLLFFFFFLFKPIP